MDGGRDKLHVTSQAREHGLSRRGTSKIQCGGLETPHGVDGKEEGPNVMVNKLKSITSERAYPTQFSAFPHVVIRVRSTELCKVSSSLPTSNATTAC